MQTVVSTYADNHNQRFTVKKASLVDLINRLNITVAALPRRLQKKWQSELKVALQEFRKNNPGIKSFNSADGTLNRTVLHVCQAIDQKLSDIEIDETMQRLPDLNWILKIIRNFRPHQVQPIQVYPLSGDTDHIIYGAWDGQHTALALYLISVHGLNMKFEEVIVPCNIYDITNRGQIRGTFINNNSYTGASAGKKSLDLIDIVEQMIYGVQVDRVDDPEWVSWYNKWKTLSAVGCFFSAEKFGNTDETGSISRLDELGKASQEVVEHFAHYCQYVMNEQASNTQKRPIDTKELPLIIQLLDMFEQEGISLSSKNIQSLAQHLIDLFDADFSTKGPFWDQCHRAVVNAWKHYNRSQNIPIEHWGAEPKNQKNVPTGYNFLWHQLSHSWAPTEGIKMPKRPGFSYTFATKDLF